MNIDSLARNALPVPLTKLSDGDHVVARWKDGRYGPNKHAGFVCLWLIRGDRAVFLASEDALENNRIRQQFGPNQTFSTPLDMLMLPYSDRRFRVLRPEQVAALHSAADKLERAA